MSSLIKELKSARALSSGKAEAERIYAGHGFESEMEDFDMLLSTLELGMEGDNTFTELELCGVVAAHTTEAGKISFTGLESIDFGTEAVIEKVKRAGYRGKAMAKKLANVVVNFVKRVINILTNKNLIIKKYDSVFEKLIDRLTTKTYDKSDKKVSVRNFSDLKSLMDIATDMNETKIESLISAVENSKDFNNFAVAALTAIVSVSHGIVGVNTMIDIKAVDKMLKDKTISKEIDKVLKEHKFDKSSEVKVSEAKTTLLAVARSIKGQLEEDVKVQKGLRDLVKACEEKRDELMADDSLDQTDADEISMLVNKMGPIVAQIQAGYTRIFKHTTGALQALATDMQKCLAA